MMDRLVCADGGNPDPTQGKDARRAKEIEMAGWDIPATWPADRSRSWCMAMAVTDILTR